ncbi:uncharacterized protein BJ171DRAFT_578899 [Polychytrium aggregatum]|uniref:uncharacterized protein n=1 Tax=Polychytrium aggregatum TaxID=110093 RepID=UPI0022FF22CC|nr:uncharacterized protein BJ171DRAFT_578899 [Polychytrium aggregatum]KAI9207165.1 hypothetical protein BJ171DRAFT_578899 [Polychytrium aggregatum]
MKSVPLLLLSLLCVVHTCLSANITLFCKCSCPPNVTILTVPKCGSCTKQYCVDSKACFRPVLPQDPSSATASLSFTSTQGEPHTTAPPMKTHAPPDEDWVVNCFQRGSYKDEIIIYSFLIVTGGLILAAVIMPYLPVFSGYIFLRAK